MKATDSLRILTDKETIAFTLERSDIELWLFEPMPCILVMYDAEASVSYWLYLQAYFESLEKFDLSKIGETFTVRLSQGNILNEEAIRKFAKYRDEVLKQLQGVIRHHA